MANKGTVKVNRETLIRVMVGLRDTTITIAQITTTIKQLCDNADEAMSGGDADNIVEHFRQIGKVTSNIRGDVATLSKKLNEATDKVDQLDSRTASSKADAAVEDATKKSKLRKE